MRLLNAKTLGFEEFMNEKTVPQYAILSHTWGAEEVTYQDFRDGISPAVQQKTGFTKIRWTCQQAKAEGLEFCWVDTCCIDKSSSVELSEAINSMFRFYSRSAVCYAYLNDVEVVAGAATDLWQSKWFSRGWTLQELIAPSNIEFFGSAWMFFGDGKLLADSLSEITGVDVEVLRRERPLKAVCVARRMSWAAGRQTTRVEDVAYSLLGIFDVNMPLLYGEGHKAFYRLQEQIIHDSGDDSILAWDYFKPEQFNEDIDLENVLLAPSPDFFRACRNVRHCRRVAWNDVVDLTNHGLRFKSQYINGLALKNLHREGPYPSEGEIVLLNCYHEDKPGLRYALRIQQHTDDGSGEKGYSVFPQARNGGSFQPDVLWAMSVGLCTRLVLVDRKAGQIGSGRETYLITRTLSAEEVRFRATATLSSFSHRLEFEQVLRPSNSYLESNKQILSPAPFESVDQFHTVEEHSGDSWSINLPSQNRQKLVIVGACIRDRVSNRRFLLICGHQDSSISPRRADDGDYGIELRSTIDNAYGHSPTASRHSGALLAVAEAIRKTCNTPRNKQYTLNLPGVGIIKAACDMGDFEGLTMIVKITLLAADQKIQRKEKGSNVGRRFSSWVSRADFRTAVGNTT